MVSIFSFFRMHKHAKQFSVSIRSIVTFKGVPSSTGRRSSFPFSSGRKHRRFKEANTGRERYFAVASRIVHNFKNSSREEAAFLCSSADNRAMIGSEYVFRVRSDFVFRNAEKEIIIRMRKGKFKRRVAKRFSVFVARKAYVIVSVIAFQYEGNEIRGCPRTLCII